MPVKIRDVPIHPDDDYACRGDAGPVQETKYNAPFMWALGFKSYNGGFHEKLRFGWGLKWLINGIYDKKKRNYTNDVGAGTRGTGAALTFVGLQARGLIPETNQEAFDAIFNLTPELAMEYTLNKDFFVGMSLTYLKMQAVNGWDRYNGLETKKSFTLTHVFPLGLYVSWKDSITVGGRYNFAFNTGQGDDSDAGMSRFDIFISLGFSSFYPNK